MPRVLLHAEGLAVLALSIFFYWRFTDGTWWLFALLLLAPDAAMLPYIVNKNWGTASYNIAHTYVLPIVLALAALLLSWQTGIALALIWAAHIGMDRTVGYGLKYSTAFKDTHLGRV